MTSGPESACGLACHVFFFLAVALCNTLRSKTAYGLGPHVERAHIHIAAFLHFVLRSCKREPGSDMFRFWKEKDYKLALTPKLLRW